MSEADEQHGFDDKYNQDAVLYREDAQYCAAVLANGISTCAKSAKGAEIACAAMTEYLLRHARRFFAMKKQKTARCLLSHICFQLQRAAEETGEDLEEFSSTAACVLFDRVEKKMLYFNLGDSLILGTKEQCCQVIAQPNDCREGFIVTTTEGAASLASVGVVDALDFDTVMLCSEGAWQLMYQRSRMDDTVKKLLLEQEFAELEDMLKGKKGSGDCSFIAVGLKTLHRRRYM